MHVDEPSAQVDWSAGAVSLLTEQKSWESNGEPRRAGVSSFGISGTNAHVILEEAPAVVSGNGAGGDNQALTGSGVVLGNVEQDAPDGGVLLGTGVLLGGVLPWVLSAKTEGALHGQAGRLLERVRGSVELDMGDVGFSLVTGRSVFEHRAVVLGGEREQLLGALGALARGGPAMGVVQGVASVGGVGGLVFLFTGQGSQRVGMGRQLYEAFGVFRGALDEVCTRLDERLGCSLRGVLFGDGEPGLLDQTLYTQAGLFALEVALFGLVESWGVRPDFLIGHSIGEVASAYVAGVFSLDDACSLVAARGRLMGALPQGGAMVSIQAGEREVLETLEGLQGRVALAAVNGPSAVVVSGDEDAVLDLAGLWEERGRKTKGLRVSHAFHSQRMDSMLEEFRAVAQGISFSAPRIPIVSNLTGEPVLAEQVCSAEYWVRHVREPVRFADGVRWLQTNGVRSFLELGPDGVLSAMSQDCLVSQSKTKDGADTEDESLCRGGPGIAW